MSIESLDQFVNHCAACKYLSHRCCKYKELAWCDKWNRKVEDFLATCIHFERNLDLPPVDPYYDHTKKVKFKKQLLLEETDSLFFGEKEPDYEPEE